MNARLATPFPTLLAALALLAFAVGHAQSPDFDDLLRTLDARSTFSGDFAATITLETTDPNEGDDARQVQFFRRDAQDTFLLLIQKPESQLGQGYLNIEDGLWFYDPESRQFTYTSLAESFEGSDANNADFESSSFAEDYRVVGSSEGTLGRYEVWILDLEASNEEVTYPFRKIWVTRDENLLLKSEDYSLTKRLLRTSYYPSYAKIGDSYIADRTIFVDALVENKQTSITLTNISTAAIPDSVFTKAYVERVNR